MSHASTWRRSPSAPPTAVRTTPGRAISRAAAALIVVAALGAALAAPATPEPAAPTPPAIIPIPVPEIAERAAEVAALLRQTGEPLADDRRVPDIEKRLPESTEWIGARLVSTAQTLSDSPPSSVLANLTDSWTLARSRLDGWNQTLTSVARGLERQQSQLDVLRATWAASRAEAVGSGAPAPVLDRINATVASIVTAHHMLGERRTRVLRLQDRVVKEMARCDDVLGKIARAREELSGRMLTRDSAPIWRAVPVFSDAGPRLRRSLDDKVELIRQYLAAQVVGVALQLALLVVALALLGPARRREAPASRVTTDADVFEVRNSAALVLVLLGTPWINHPPRAVITGVALLILAPVLRIIHRLAPRELLPAVYALAGFFVVDRFRDLCADLPGLERSVFLVEMVFGIAFLALALHSESLMMAAGAHEASRARRVIAYILWLGMGVLGFAVVAGAVGYMHLARYLGAPILASSYAALVLYAAVRIADGLCAYLLHARPSSSLRMVREHHERLQRGVSRAIRWLAVGVWGYFTAEDLGMTGTIQSSLATLLAVRYARGSISLSVGDIVAFALTVAAAFLLSSVLRFVMREEIYPRARLAHGQSYALSILLHYAVILVGFLFAASALGVDLTRVTILAGAFGVGIGIGLQNVVANFVAGVILLLEQRVHVGDSIETGDLQGEIREIGFRASTVHTWTGAEVIVPNSKLTSERVTNWTLSDPICRVDLNVTLAYSADTAAVLDVLRKAAEADVRILAEPRTLVLCTGFRENGLSFEVRVWTRFDHADDVRSALALVVHTALTTARIEIATPQRDVHILSARSEDIDGLRPQPSDVDPRNRTRHRAAP